MILKFAPEYQKFNDAQQAFTIYDDDCNPNDPNCVYAEQIENIILAFLSDSLKTAFGVGLNSEWVESE